MLFYCLPAVRFKPHHRVYFSGSLLWILTAFCGLTWTQFAALFAALFRQFLRLDLGPVSAVLVVQYCCPKSTLFRDIDECDEKMDSCSDICSNVLAGSYTCSCPHGQNGDGRKGGTGCFALSKDKKFPWQVFLGIGFSLLFSLIVSTWLYWAVKKRRLIKLKDKFFDLQI